MTTFTHCSNCGRKLRAKHHRGGLGTTTGSWTDWLNHALTCQDYGAPPNAVAAGVQDTTTNEEG